VSVAGGRRDARRLGAVAGEPARPASARRRVRVRVEGVVQGVGFRPHVYRLARELALGGVVRNDERGVLVEAEGSGEAIEAFLPRLVCEAPPLAVVESIHVVPAVPTGERGFAIVASARGGEAVVPVTPDGAVCADCLAEVLDPADRRYRYPFATCTNCGPRYSIVLGVPYDRARTTMASFALCDACRAEYEDPADRRFHAEPIACPACGPVARLLRADGTPTDAACGGEVRPVDDEAPGDAAWPGRDAVAAAAAALRAGRIIAVKGLGGYHLACRADDEAAVATLRARKHREDKPFALMAPDLATVAALVALTPADERLLESPLRPILLAPRRDHCTSGLAYRGESGSDRRAAPIAPARVAPSVAPRSADLGVMLPSTPLHHLLLRDAGCGALVMTSGNRSDEPIAHEDEDALARLAGIADLFLVHDRPIHVRTDDSVVRAVGGRRPVWVRRSRGAVPGRTPLPLAAPRPLLAMGGELKSTCCVAKGRRAWVGHHIGDLQSWETLQAFRQSVAHLERLFDVTPQLVAHDAHPDYRATVEAHVVAEARGIDRLAVWHHHAHLAATLAEHGETGPAVGAIFDGAGLGPDGTVWGGELLVGDLAGFERAGRLHDVRLPGGDRAAREPWRMACAWLAAAAPGGGVATTPPSALRAHVARRSWQAVAALARGDANDAAAPTTTSIGRLFDAVAALAGLRAVATYEGQAAAELEAAAAVGTSADRAPATLDGVRFAAQSAPARATAPNAQRAAYPFPLTRNPDGTLTLDARETILAVARDAAGGATPAEIAARFHHALARATAAACERIARERGLATVALGGGVWVNRLLLQLTTTELQQRGLRVLVPERLPPGDGGLAYGQAAIAAATDAA
jgi:hydrogenase maturation protein HypF